MTCWQSDNVLCRASLPVERRDVAGDWTVDDVLWRGTSGRTWAPSRDADTDDWVLHQPWRLPRLPTGRLHRATEEVWTVRKHQRTTHTGSTLSVHTWDPGQPSEWINVYYIIAAKCLDCNSRQYNIDKILVVFFYYTTEWLNRFKIQQRKLIVCNYYPT